MVFIGLTGVIGAGKSEALEACRRLGAAVLSADDVVHEILDEPEVRDLLVERFGQRVLSGDRIDRDAVAEVVFQRPEELSWLENVLFPRVGEQIARWRTKLEQAEHNPKVAVVEVSLLFESGMEGIFDAVVAVVAEAETRGRRVGAGRPRVDAGRHARQLSQAEKARRADFVVRNDGTMEELEDAVREVLKGRLGGQGCAANAVTSRD